MPTCGPPVARSYDVVATSLLQVLRQSDVISGYEVLFNTVHCLVLLSCEHTYSLIFFYLIFLFSVLLVYHLSHNKQFYFLWTGMEWLYLSYFLVTFVTKSKYPSIVCIHADSPRHRSTITLQNGGNTKYELDFTKSADYLHPSCFLKSSALTKERRTSDATSSYTWYRKSLFNCPLVDIVSMLLWKSPLIFSYLGGQKKTWSLESKDSRIEIT